jgi:beta-lactam-binding protein with PASTA domain/tRNA A-37 threonylcarbamoyl transferase component Bud32
MSLVGRVFSNRYEIERELAQGGMAEVYLGHDRLLDRPVALKALFPEYAREPSFVERFRREAQAAANLNNANIVGIYDWGQEAGTYFIVMEYVEGRALRDLIRSESPLDPNQASEIAAEIGSALAFAHRAGVVHRDVKPGNVLLTRAGNVKVTDFGIARAGTSDGLTQTGSVMGTATYFSPEQAQGLAVDGRSDVYSLGVVLYEMVTGVVPFTGDSPVAVAYKHVREEPMPPSQRNPDVPADLEQIILTALAKDPDHRYQTADDMRADLLRFRRGRPLAAAPVTALIAEVPAVGAAAVGAGVAVAATMQQPAVPAAGVDGGPPSGEPPTGKRRALMWTLIVLGLVIVVGLIIAFATLAGSGDGDVSVPDVRNQPIAQATATLKAKGFKVTTETAISTDVAEGNVIDQDPQPGDKANKGSDVTLTVSGGAGQVNVPDVDNTSFDDAQQALTSEGFKVQRRDEASETVAKDLVIRTDPAGGTPADKNSTVQVFVSTGKEQKPIPDVSGLSEDDGFAQLGQAGFAVRTVSESSSSVSSGKVTRTDPVAGTLAARGSTVRMFVSTGNPSVSVPNVIGQTEADARSALSAKGLTASTITQVDPANVGKVIAQTPSGGSPANPGSTVTLTIGGAGPTTTTTTTAPAGP